MTVARADGPGPLEPTVAHDRSGDGGRAGVLALGRDDEAIVNSVESGEDYLKEKFETVMNNKDLPAEALSAVNEAWQSVREGHDQTSQLMIFIIECPCILV